MELSARVNAPRAVVTTTPGFAETLARDWRKVARFYARFGITEAMFRKGVPAGNAAGDRVMDAIWKPISVPF